MLDTKYMASITPLKELINSSVLGDIDKILDKEPFPSVKIGSYFILFYYYFKSFIIVLKLIKKIVNTRIRTRNCMKLVMTLI